MSVNLSIGNITITEEFAEELARERHELWLSATQGCTTHGDGLAAGELRGFNKLAELLGIMPAITRASERLRRQREITAAMSWDRFMNEREG